MNENIFGNQPEKKFRPELLGENSSDLEEFSFKPISKGLGFHNEEKPKTIVRRNNVKKQLHSSLGRAAGRVARVENEITYPLPKSSLSQNAEFEKKEIPVKVKKLKKATFKMQFAAFFIDLFLIIFFNLSILCACLYAADITLEFWSDPLLFSSVLKMLGLFFIFSFVGYFSLFELSSSFGKSFFNLAVVKKSGKKMELSDSILRSLTSLFSLFLLGIPSLLNLSDKISETKVVEISRG